MVIYRHLLQLRLYQIRRKIRDFLVEMYGISLLVGKWLIAIYISRCTLISSYVARYIGLIFAGTCKCWCVFTCLMFYWYIVENRPLYIIAELISSAKKSLARMLLIIVSLGYGTVKWVRWWYKMQILTYSYITLTKLHTYSNSHTYICINV